jgi:hypothetical protein
MTSTDPLDPHLHLLAASLHIDDDSLDDLPHDLFAIGIRGRWSSEDAREYLSPDDELPPVQIPKANVASVGETDDTPLPVVVERLTSLPTPVPVCEPQAGVPVRLHVTFEQPVQLRRPLVLAGAGRRDPARHAPAPSVR